MASSSGKMYGLITRQPKKTPVLLPKLSAFGDSSDEEESAHSAVNQSLQYEATKQRVKKQTQLEIQRALEEDPTVYEYDSIYDSMEEKKQQKTLAKKAAKDSKPKYMENLFKAAQRKREQERLQERKVQREREAEGLEFADKEAFVTSAYKKKMEELAEEEERERREAEMEAANDVTKQKDMSGFYRHILNQTTSGSDQPKQENVSDNETDIKIKVENVEKSDNEARHQTHMDEDSRKEKHHHKTERHTEDKHRGSDRQSDSHSRKHRDDERDRRGNRTREEKEEDGYRDKDQKVEERKRTSGLSEKQDLPDTNERGSSEDLTVRKDNGDASSEAKDRQKEQKREAETAGSKFAKRNADESVMSAKERYLARKAAKGNVKAHVTVEDD